MAVLGGGAFSDERGTPVVWGLAPETIVDVSEALDVSSREFKLPWREAGPPNHFDDQVDSDQ